MKLQPLYDLQQEVNRLFIAGSKFAKNDPRLLKQIPVFTKLGEKAPVFKKIAQEIEALSQAESNDSVEKLTSLSTLLYAILYTQGETWEEENELTPNQTLLSLDAIQNPKSYFQLKPLINALSTSNQGRLAILETALKENLFDDFRLYPYLNKALGDKYSELAQFVEEKIIPSIGKNMLPYLYQSLSYEGKTEDARRLRLLNVLGHQEIDNIVKKVFESSATNMQAEATLILAKDKANEAMIIALTQDKQKPVREAAYKALAQMKTKNTWQKLIDFFLENKKKTDLEAIVNAISSSNEMEFLGEMIAKLNTDFEALLKLDKPEDEKAFEKIFDQLNLSILVFMQKESKEVYAFFEQFFSTDLMKLLTGVHKKMIGYNHLNNYYNLLSCLKTYSAKSRFAFFETLIPTLKIDANFEQLYNQYFYDCLELNVSKERIFDIFSKFYEKKYFSIHLMVNNYVENYRTIENFNLYKIHHEEIDIRWVDLIAKNTTKKTDEEMLFLHLMTPKNDAVFNYLLIKYLSSKETQSYYNFHFPYQMIMAREIPDKHELIYKSLEKYKNGNSYYYVNQLVNLDFWKDFPKEYAEKFRALQPKNNSQNYFNNIADKIAGLENTTQNI